MQITKEKLKIIGGGIVVLAAASVMLGPLMTYIAGLGRMISFIVTAILIAYLITFVVKKLRGKKTTNPQNNDANSYTSRGGDSASEQGDVEV